MNKTLRECLLFTVVKPLGVFSSCSCERKAYYAAWRHNMTGPGAVSHRDSNPGMIRPENPSTLLWVQHYHQGVASITGRGRRGMNVSVYPGLHHSVVLHPGLICHHRQGGSLIYHMTNAFLH